jgi:uridine kinase
MILVGVSGPSAAGKSLLCRSLKAVLVECEILQQDWYYKHPDDLDPVGNYCDPQWLSWERFVTDVRRLAAGEAIEIEVMDGAFCRTGEIAVVRPGSITLIEGMTIFRSPELMEMFDVSLYLDPGLPMLSSRKWHRDRVERGKTDEEIRHQLRWVEEEYLADLRLLPSSVRRICAGRSQERVMREALECIVSTFRRESLLGTETRGPANVAFPALRRIPSGVHAEAIR